MAQRVTDSTAAREAVEEQSKQLAKELRAAQAAQAALQVEADAGRRAQADADQRLAAAKAAGQQLAEELEHIRRGSQHLADNLEDQKQVPFVVLSCCVCADHLCGSVTCGVVLVVSTRSAARMQFAPATKPPRRK